MVVGEATDHPGAWVVEGHHQLERVVRRLTLEVVAKELDLLIAELDCPSLVGAGAAIDHPGA